VSAVQTAEQDVIYQLAQRMDDPEAIASLPGILRYLVTEEEARLLLGLPVGRLGTAEEVQKATGADLADVQAVLRKAYTVGLLAPRTRDSGEREYGFADVYVDSICGDYRNNVHGQKYRDPWVQWTREQIERRDATNGQSYMGAGRVAPAPEVFHEHETASIVPYEDVRTIIRTSHRRAIGQCPCKFRNGGCDYPMADVCLMLDHMADCAIERGSHKELTVEEALAAMKRVSEAGLVHMASDDYYMSSSCGTEFICSCCGCCCAFFEHYHEYPELGKIVSNYCCEVDAEKCVGCGACVEKCFFNATKLVDGKSVIDLEKCLGCGVCAVLCAQNATTVIRKKGEIAKRPEAQRHFIEPILPPEGESKPEEPIKE